MGEARRRKLLGAQVPPPDRTRKALSEQHRTAALVMYLFAVLNWEPGPDEDDDEERWSTHCMNMYSRHPNRDSFGACVWWALRHENSSQRELTGESWLGYLAHVCRNHGILAR